MPATNAWLRSRFLSSPGCFRIRSRQTSSVSAGSSASGPISSSAQPGTARSTPPAAGRPCPSGSGRDTGSPGAASVRGSHVAPRVQLAGLKPGVALASAEPRTRRSCVGCLARRGQLESPGEHRVDHDAVAVEVDLEELAAPAHAVDSAARRGRRARRRAPDSGTGAVADSIGRPRRAASKASATIVRSGNSGTAADCSCA